jgi:drug/metabolite transporter (DMT)-like permease
MFFSLSFVWFKVANESYGPLTIIFFRLVVSSLFLLVLNSVSRKLMIPTRQEWLLIILLGFFEPFLYFICESYGLQLLSSTVGAVIISTIPLVSPFATFLFMKEPISGRYLLCVLVSFFGVALVVMQPTDGVLVSWLGVLLMCGAVCAGVAYSVVLHKIPLRLNILSVLTYQNIIGAICFAPLWGVIEYKRFMNTPVDSSGVVAILKLSIVVSTLAYMFFSYSVRRLGVNRANMFLNMIPVFTAIFAWVILGENLTFLKGIGICITIVGLSLAARLRRDPSSTPVPSA